MPALRLIPAALVLFALSPLAPCVAAGAQAPVDADPVTAPGGAFEPLGPVGLTPAQPACRQRARRALGLGAPRRAKARRHLDATA